VREATPVVATKRAGQSVVDTVQYRPPEADIGQAASTAPAPAEAQLFASPTASRGNASVALFLPP
jgi:hypothetical protein